jgi:6-phosphogluconolactonase
MTRETAMNHEMFAYVGGYTTPDRDGRGDGLRVYRVNAAGDAWTEVQHIGGLENPSLFTLRRNHSVLYSVHGGRNHVSAFARGRDDGRLVLLNQMECGGSNPVDSALDPTERFLIVGNYGSGTVAVMPLDSDGRLCPASQRVTLTGQPGPDPTHQTSSHPHAVIFDPTGQFVIVPDKGFDKTFFFRFDAGRLTPCAHGAVAATAGAAPRHAAFHPSLPVLYVNNELDSTVTVFDWDGAIGQATVARVIGTIPDGHAGRNTTAEIAASPCGRFLYVSNRGQDSIVLFRVANQTGHLTYVGTTPTGGARPRFFALDPTATRLYAANQDSDDITGFHIDPDTGALRPMGIVTRVGSPSAISFVPCSGPS